jgi:hypothetical protein
MLYALYIVYAVYTYVQYVFYVLHVVKGFLRCTDMYLRRTIVPTR